MRFSYLLLWIILLNIIRCSINIVDISARHYVLTPKGEVNFHAVVNLVGQDYGYLTIQCNSSDVQLHFNDKIIKYAQYIDHYPIYNGTDFVLKNDKDTYLNIRIGIIYNSKVKEWYGRSLVLYNSLKYVSHVYDMLSIEFGEVDYAHFNVTFSLYQCTTEYNNKHSYISSLMIEEALNASICTTVLSKRKRHGKEELFLDNGHPGMYFFANSTDDVKYDKNRFVMIYQLTTPHSVVLNKLTEITAIQRKEAQDFIGLFLALVFILLALGIYILFKRTTLEKLRFGYNPKPSFIRPFRGNIDFTEL
eukprot:TRINITY_DN2939_c0_g4_i1.p1 TRINITY_DN2939_c0_g4~~TRINITY_DN2939_c0_g4_i1.p1  ORF type:complete len:305 (+),score=48.71 TRINITY_DN2939_c0_g4_i1:63-977(+)